jgi:hypothetical protein
MVRRFAHQTKTQGVIPLCQAVEEPASPGFFDNKRKKDVAAAAAL